MTRFNICGQCMFFIRLTEPDEDDQVGECIGMPAQVVVIENEVQFIHPAYDPAHQACALFREDKR